MYGGATQGGIQPSAQTPNVLVYSDPEQGALYGYNFDGWEEEVFLYTGEGRKGDQQMKVGNLAIAKHVEQGRDLRLFTAKGKIAGTNTKTHRYEGEFWIDPELPFTLEDASDVNGDLRAVFVFRLLSTNPGAQRTESASRSEAGDDRSAQLSALERVDTEEFTQTGSGDSRRALRREAQLVKSFDAHLQHLGHQTGRFKLRSRQTVRPMWTDLFDQTDSILYEAKGSASRVNIRLAIGQLYDYRRFIAQDVDLAVLIPSKPSQDMVELLASLSIGCVWREPDGSFLGD